MNSDHLSKRLKTVASYVKPNSRVADIGSDHAYLPIWLAKNKIINFGIAGEVVKGPFQNAEHEIEQAGLKEIIIARLADGLDAIEPSDQVDTVTIAGMGGTLISNILERGISKLNNVKYLILQPNVGEKNLRIWLMEHRYRITDEQILFEDKHTYEIIYAEAIDQKLTYSNQELTFGPFLLNNPNEVFKNKWMSEREQLKKVIQKIESSQTPNINKISEMKNAIIQIDEVLKNEN